MRVLFATSEVAPLIKTGGLADVSAALPAALSGMGVDVRILLPGYPQVLKALPHLQDATDIPIQPGFPAARLLASSLPNGVPLFVIECAELYERGGGQQRFAIGLAVVQGREQALGQALSQLAGQGQAVGVDAAGGQQDDGVTGAQLFAQGQEAAEGQHGITDTSTLDVHHEVLDIAQLLAFPVVDIIATEGAGAQLRSTG